MSTTKISKGKVHCFYSGIYEQLHVNLLDRCGVIKKSWKMNFLVKLKEFLERSLDNLHCG